MHNRFTPKLSRDFFKFGKICDNIPDTVQDNDTVEMEG